MSQPPVFKPSDFVAVLNQTLEFSYPSVVIQGEIVDFRVRKNKWVYFKLVDENASVSFFGSVYQLSYEVREGMLLEVRGHPRLHPLYGFSVQVQSLQPVGEGSIKKSADLLMEKLKKEGLFESTRKRLIEVPPQRIGLITSAESAAYQDVIKILTNRWSGLGIEVIDVHVQGESAQADICSAVAQFAEQADPPDVLLLTRGGGSAEDLAVFSTEHVTRAVADSRIPIVVAIGHETDISLAELAADMRASTPSNAAEMLVPHKDDVLVYLSEVRERVAVYMLRIIQQQRETVANNRSETRRALRECLAQHKHHIHTQRNIVRALDPYSLLQRGYAVVRTKDGRAVRSGKDIRVNDEVSIILKDAKARALVQSVGDNKPSTK